MFKKFLIFFPIVLFFPAIAFAQDNQFVTIVNPVRISQYTVNPKESLASEYFQIERRNLPATWLFNYQTLANPDLVAVAKSMNVKQELGILLEVTPDLATASGVQYNKTDSWHRATSVFLIGYSQEERTKIIDTVFAKFRSDFGYYPKSIGAWWIDSFSLKYAQEKYGVEANLICSDQFSTDGYQIWGIPWSTTFYPSKLHAGIPAQSEIDKLPIVTMQWAARDPLNGYGDGKASLFSTQDYFDINYFKKLFELYSQAGPNKFGQLVFGLEADLQANAYSGFYSQQLDLVTQKIAYGEVIAANMKDFSKWYSSNFPLVSPVQTYLSEDLMGKKIKSLWYNSNNYRINLVYDESTNNIVIKDFRIYQNNFQEPYYVSPDKNLDLRINIPSIIDAVSDHNSQANLFSGQWQSINTDNEIVEINFDNHKKIVLKPKQIIISGSSPEKFIDLSKSRLISVDKMDDGFSVSPVTDFSINPNGLTFRELTVDADALLHQKKFWLFMLCISSVYFYYIKSYGRNKKSLVIGVFVFFGLLTLAYFSHTQLYSVSQSEYEALSKMRSLTGKKIVVVDNRCLQCHWSSNIQPAAFANYRDYVAWISNKKIIYNSAIFKSPSRQDSKANLDKLQADYIYLVNYENYSENMPFSPGDLNVEKIYANANSEIWRVNR